MKKIIVLFSCLLLGIFGLWQIRQSVLAEQSGSSPESGTDSQIKQAYDWLVAKGTNYGSTDAADWTNNWGTYWNRMMEAAAWEPDGSATAGEVPSGLTFYAGNGDRDQKTGTLFENQLYVRYDDWLNSGGTTNEYMGEESTWTQTASGGTAQSVTDNSVTRTLSSNTVYQDGRTKLYWSDMASVTVDNEFAWVTGDDAENPSNNSCNFNSTGTANAYCDNQDPLTAYAEDDDVSAADFCLNLELDADNADSDDDGATGTETDWRLPTQKELMQAYINGAANNLPNPASYFWSSTENYSSQSLAWGVYLGYGYTDTSTKVGNTYVRCVRRSQ